MKLTLPIKKVHFIGIGGIGMSAIAEMLHSLNISVQGSNDTENANTKRLSEKGIPVFIGHDINNLDGSDAVVISSAIKQDNPELVEAHRRGLAIGHRSEMLAEILKYKQSICVAGTHGKTTTSSLIASLLIEGGKKPSFVIGGILNAITYVLVAFTSISLVVSSVMIGIITYVSVVERTKEIGVLR